MIKKLHLWGWTYEEIGNKVGLTKGRISQMFNSTDFGKIKQEIEVFLSQGKTMDWIADHYSIDMQLAWAIRLWEKSDEFQFYLCRWETLTGDISSESRTCFNSTYVELKHTA